MGSPGIRQLLSGTTPYSSVEICIFRHEIVGVKKMQPTTMGAFGSCTDDYKNGAITVFYGYTPNWVKWWSRCL